MIIVITKAMKIIKSQLKKLGPEKVKYKFNLKTGKLTISIYFKNIKFNLTFNTSAIVIDVEFRTDDKDLKSKTKQKKTVKKKKSKNESAGFSNKQTFKYDYTEPSLDKFYAKLKNIIK